MCKYWRAVCKPIQKLVWHWRIQCSSEPGGPWGANTCALLAYTSKSRSPSLDPFLTADWVQFKSVHLAYVKVLSVYTSITRTCSVCIERCTSIQVETVFHAVFNISSRVHVNYLPWTWLTPLCQGATLKNWWRANWKALQSALSYSRLPRRVALPTCQPVPVTRIQHTFSLSLSLSLSQALFLSLSFSLSLS